jgi:hypothetical protein
VGNHPRRRSGGSRNSCQVHFNLSLFHLAIGFDEVVGGGLLEQVGGGTGGGRPVVDIVTPSNPRFDVMARMKSVPTRVSSSQWV